MSASLSCLPPAVPQPGEHPSDYCGPCKSGQHAKCYEPCLCRDRNHGELPARTLPVTPAERACATVLRVYLAWNVDEANDPEGTFEWWSMVKLGDYLETRGLVGPLGHKPSDAGRALLAKVDAAERTERAAWIRLVKAERKWHAQTELWGERDHDMKGAFAEVDAAEQALRDLGIDPDTGTTPLDAPPAKEPR